VTSVLVVGTGDAGGIGRYERLLMAALARLEGEGRIALSSAWRARHPDYLLGDDGPPTGDSGGQRPMAEFAARTAWQMRRTRPDVTVFTTVNLARLALPFAAARVRMPSVICIHGIEAWTPLDRLRRAALLGADRVVASASYNEQQLRSVQGVRAGRIEVIPLSLAPEWDMGNGADPAAGAHAGARLLTVARLSTVDSYKGIDRTIEALPAIAERVPGVTYRVVGDGDDRGRLEALAHRHGVADRIEFAGMVDDAGLKAEYAACDLFVLPSKGEGFGLVLLEAMAHGRPVVASAVGGPLDVVDDGRTGLLVEDDAELADAVASLLEDPARLETMGDQARERVERSFSFDLYTRRWGELVGRVADRSGAGLCAA
jgi:phosphatidyl-myo-inositol dimannoside synthase